MLNLVLKYAGRITGATANYPYGSSKNETGPGVGDGTPYELARADDVFGFQQALIRAAGIVPTNNSDTALASQQLQAVIELISGRATAYDDGGVADAYVMDLRANQQFAGGLFIGLAVKFTPANDGTGAATLDYNTTVDALVDRVGNALTGGELIAGIEATAIFDGVDWRLMTGVEVDLLTDTFTHEIIADAAYTLTVDENRSGRIVITDTVVTLTGAVNIVVADIKRTFFAQNDTAETLTFKTSAGTGTTVGAGLSKILLCDGVNIVDPNTSAAAASGNIFGRVGLTGVINGGTGFTVAKGAAGFYTITHNLGTTNYTVLITSTASMNAGYESITNNTFIIRITDVILNALADNEFHFIIFPD